MLIEYIALAIAITALSLGGGALLRYLWREAAARACLRFTFRTAAVPVMGEPAEREVLIIEAANRGRKTIAIAMVIIQNIQPDGTQAKNVIVPDIEVPGADRLPKKVEPGHSVRLIFDRVSVAGRFEHGNVTRIGLEDRPGREYWISNRAFRELKKALCREPDKSGGR